MTRWREWNQATGRFVRKDSALAAGSGTAETRETAAQCEASQSGGDSRNAQTSPDKSA